MLLFIARPSMTETTALGAAMAAGSAEGIEVWDLTKLTPLTTDDFTPSIMPEGVYMQSFPFNIQILDSIKEMKDLCVSFIYLFLNV